MVSERKMKKLVVANWKMNPGTIAEAVKLFGEIKKMAAKTGRVQTVICAPFIHLPVLLGLVSGQRLVLGAQNCFYERTGAFTGEVSPSQLVSLGVQYVILGHSERRQMGENDVQIGQKVTAALKEGLSVILCVGEEVRDEEGEFLSIVRRQLEIALANIPRRYFLNLRIAYEPIWAISTHSGGEESPEDMLKMSIYLRKQLAVIAGKDMATKIPLLYGGSVDEQNVAGYLARGGVQGVLVGRASLWSENFTHIIKIANETSDD